MSLSILPRSAMSPAFLAYLDSTLIKEGGATYTNDPDDRGGPSKYGVTQALARSAGYEGDMRDLTADQAATIYWRFMWAQPGLDKIDTVMPALAALIFQLGVNTGMSVPIKMMQRVLNVLNNQASLWPDLVLDGGVGMMTVGALKAFLLGRGDEGKRVLLLAVKGLMADRYIMLCENDATQEKYGWGWLSQRAFPK